MPHIKLCVTPAAAVTITAVSLSSTAVAVPITAVTIVVQLLLPQQYMLHQFHSSAYAYMQDYKCMYGIMHEHSLINTDGRHLEPNKVRLVIAFSVES